MAAMAAASHTMQALQCWQQSPQPWQCSPALGLPPCCIPGESDFYHSGWILPAGDFNAQPFFTLVAFLVVFYPFQTHSSVPCFLSFPLVSQCCCWVHHLRSLCPCPAVLSMGKYFSRSDSHVSPFQYPIYNFHFCIPKAVLLLSSSFSFCSCLNDAVTALFFLCAIYCVKSAIC